MSQFRRSACFVVCVLAITFEGCDSLGKYETMTFVPAGRFTMGATREELERLARDDPKVKRRFEKLLIETPTTTVSVDAFYIDVHEVTNAQYRLFLEDVVRQGHEVWCHPDERPGMSHRPKFIDDERFGAPSLPVVGVDWYDAFAYARWAGKRLPTEAEWEKAARGTGSHRYPWGNEWSPKLGNFGTKEDLFRFTAPVDSFPEGRSVYGCFNMAGNAAEWTSSPFRPYPYAPPDRREDVMVKGARAYRGGSYADGYPYALRCSKRERLRRGYQIPMRNLGFRCAVSASR